MMYFTTFILTLLLSHIARATPACSDDTSPEELYDPTYADAQHALPLPLPIVEYNVTWSSKYDNRNGSTENVTCSNPPNGLEPRYPHFGDFPLYPNIGGAFNIKWGSPNCGECWNLTNLKTNEWIIFTAIDAATTGFNVSKESFIKLNGGNLGSTLQAEARVVLRSLCYWHRPPSDK